MKKVIAVLLTIIMTFSLVACHTTTTLGTPANVQISEQALISWDSVPNATSYKVVINGQSFVTEGNSYQVMSTVESFSCYIVATADGYNDSAHSDTCNFVGRHPIVPPTGNVKIAITGNTQVKSGKAITLKATVSGATDNSVSWQIIEGAQYATINSNGKLTANEVDGDKLVKVLAQSNADSTKTATKIVKLVARQELTQDMLDAIGNENKLAFEGYINISLYTLGLFPKLHSTHTSAVKTALDGNNWYAEYDNTTTGTKNNLYYKNNNGKACQVGVNFLNQESYIPLIDEDNNTVSWQDSGMYNNFSGLQLSDFSFDDDTWRWVYNGSDSTLANRMLASANPYDFDPQGISLILDEGKVAGIYSESKDDYTLMQGYRGVQELFVLVNRGESVVIPTIGRYSTEDIHGDLQVAIDNMRNLQSYTLNFKEITGSYLATGYVQSGFTETITEDNCFMRPYKITYDQYGKEQKNYLNNSAYGYQKKSETLFNSYAQSNDGQYHATRAYAKGFDSAKPSFEFAPEIFREYYIDEAAGTTTYYVADVMSSVASTFYYGVGNDINIYGIFATRGFTSQTKSFTPYVVVKDGYIVEACFYFYLGSLYGVVELDYSDFNTATMDTQVEFDTRQVPASWADLTIIQSNESGSTTDDQEVNALDFLKGFYANNNIQEVMPFFGVPLGDTYGFGLTTFHISYSDNKAHQAVVFYYDVPLEIDYSINQSLTNIKDYLISLGFVKNRYDEFTKDNIVVAPVDSGLDLMIYIWKV